MHAMPGAPEWAHGSTAVGRQDCLVSKPLLLFVGPCGLHVLPDLSINQGAAIYSLRVDLAPCSLL